MRDFDERDIWDVRESLSERIASATGGHWALWLALFGLAAFAGVNSMIAATAILMFGLGQRWL